jgi:hypothetical protein
MHTKLRLPVFVLSAVISLEIAATTFGGPSFVTDDPEPVDYQLWEFYLASMHSELRGDWSGTAPHFEVNYGAVPDLQLQMIAPMTRRRKEPVIMEACWCPPPERSVPRMRKKAKR